jgi:hypothetical protein
MRAANTVAALAIAFGLCSRPVEAYRSVDLENLITSPDKAECAGGLQTGDGCVLLRGAGDGLFLRYLDPEDIYHRRRLTLAVLAGVDLILDAQDPVFRWSDLWGEGYLSYETRLPGGQVDTWRGPLVPYERCRFEQGGFTEIPLCDRTPNEAQPPPIPAPSTLLLFLSGLPLLRRLFAPSEHAAPGRDA